MSSAKRQIYCRIPAAYPLIFRNPEHVHQFYTESQPFANNRKRFWPRAKLLGGCSSINAEMAQYGAPGDFDEWAKITNDESWNWGNLKKYFMKLENYAGDKSVPDVDMNQRSTIGPVKVGYFASITQSSQAFVKACQAIGIPLSSSYNTPEGQTGVNRMITYVDEQRERVSSETAYLTPEVLSRPNLKVVVGAQVTKIIVEKSDETLRACAVEFSSGKGKPVCKATAKKEVVVSAGAIHSPQILMLSGIGPSEELKKFNIPVVHDLPGVGSHLIDHPVVDFNFKDKLREAPVHIRPSPVNIVEVFGFLKSLMRYLFFKTGPLATNGTDAAAFIRSDNTLLFEDASAVQLQDSSSGPQSPDLELFSSAVAYKEHGKVLRPPGIGLHCVLLRPLSVGRLGLRSSSPWDAPTMDPCYLKSDADVKKLARASKLILKLARTEPLASRLDHESKDPQFDHYTHLKTDDEMEQLVRERLETLYHPTSTCRMAPLEEQGVVDSHFRVYGVNALRVCDASIYPSIISGHTAGAVFAIAEKLSEELKAES